MEGTFALERGRSLNLVEMLRGPNRQYEHMEVKRACLRIIALKRPSLNDEEDIVIESLWKSFLAERWGQWYLLAFLSRSGVHVRRRELDIKRP